MNLLPVLINVAYFRVLERKVLASCQLRKGPNKVSLSGSLQPFRDAIKLFTKGITVVSTAKVIFF